MRIRKAMEYGARFVHPWKNGEGVTHIIVDLEMHYEDILRHVQLETIPEDIVVVNQRYISDCISNQILVNPKQKLYEVIRRRPHANSGKLRHAPQEERFVVMETPVQEQRRDDLRKQDAPELAGNSGLKETRTDTGMS
jgi:DNA polymerase IV